MRLLFGFIFFIIVAVCANSQTSQLGVVKEYNEKAQKTPLAGVELNVRSANSTVSDQNGEFKLNFLTLQAGEKVNVRRIEKMGYEIFNKEAVGQWNINPKDPFVVVMCKSDKFKRIRDNYERVSSESYARQLKKEEAKLENQMKEGKLKEEEYKRQLRELREDYETQLDNIDNYVDRFSRIDLSELSSTEQEIIELVQQGMIEEAIAKYEEQNYVEKYSKEVKELKEISQAINQLSEVKDSKMLSRDSILSAINRQIETLKIAGGRENFEKINQLLHDVAYADTTDVSQMVEYSRFAISQKRNNEALVALEIIKRSRDKEARDDDSFSKCIVVRRNIGNVYFAMNEFNMAEQYYLEAVKMCNEREWTDKSYLTAHLEYCEAELGRLYSVMRDFDKSEKLLLATLERKQNNYRADVNDTSIFELANVCRELSAFYARMQDFPKACKYGVMALDYFNELKDKESENNKQFLANIASDLAVSYYYVSNIQSAIKYATISLDARKDLYNFNPEKYALDLAMSYGNLGNIYSMAGEEAKAFENAVECHNLFVKLYQSNPDSYIKEYAMSSYNLATEFMEQANYDKALEMLQEVLPAIEKLYVSYPGAYSKFYVETLHVIAKCEFNIGEYNKTIAYLDQALDIIEKSKNGSEQVFIEPLINITVLKGDTKERMGQYDDSRENYIKAIEYAEISENLNPDAFLLTRLSSYHNLGLLYKTHGKTDDAIKIFDQARLKFAKYKIPKMELIYYNLAALLFSAHNNRASEILEEGLEEYPDSEGLLHLKQTH